MTKLITHEGAIITCEAGHKLLRLKREARQGDVMRASMFEPLVEGLDPKPSTKMPEKCPVEGCSEIWWRRHPKHWVGVQMHFEDGWK
jgi:hypothetical protein|tara:strand:- start:2583 stop:2843 length:261 start_codon:yes stop_codon:yes gene_type:complete